MKDGSTIIAILFDLDDTLIKTRETKYTAIKYAGKRFYNLEISDALIEKHWGKPYAQATKEIFGNVDKLDMIISKYNSIRHKFPSTAYEDAVDTVEKLLDHGVHVGIISSSARAFVLKDLETLHFPIERLFFIQGAEDVDFHKPDPKVFSPVLKKLEDSHIAKTQVLYVGDLLIDYYAARDAGLHFIGVAHSIKIRDIFTQHAIRTVQQLADLLDHI
jgi:phosphoglycolate phosphatase-like HAD superfamily hydrolase